MFKAAIATVAALGLAASTASAQYPTVVPHRGHAHVVPSYSPPIYGGYSYPSYSPGVVIGGYSSPGVTLGGYYSSPAPVIGGYYGNPTPYYSGFSGYGGYSAPYHHHHHHHH